MRAKIFYTVVVLLYLLTPLFVYKYISFNAVKEDTLRVETGVGNITAPKNDEQMNERDILEADERNVTLQSYGYLSGGIVCILCPSLLIVFRHRFL